MAGVDAVVHAATLHKPHVGSHQRAEFVDTNITGTLNLLEEAVAAGVEPVHLHEHDEHVRPRADARRADAPAAWITEDVAPVPRNIYGTTKTAAENLCELIARDHGLPCLILRTSRFFPEADDRDEVRSVYDDLNIKVNELLYRRVDIEDVVERASARARARAGDRLRPLHHQRHVAVHPRRPAPRSDTTSQASWHDCSPTTRSCTRSAAGGCSPRSSACTSTTGLAASSAGRPATTSASRSTGCATAHDPRSQLALSIGAKGYHAVSTGVYTAR